MSQNQNSTFTGRAALFASPKDSLAVPKKKVARAAPLVSRLFLDETINRTTTGTTFVQKTKTPEKTTQPLEEEDVEPMEVDTTDVPSPQKSVPTPPRGDTPCSSATTPRRKSSRKSMPTPGKRLFFTSKDQENEERQLDETTQLELLMANIPEDTNQYVKDLLTDKKEMTQYAAELTKEIEEYEAVYKSRETMLKNATEIAQSNHISSVESSTFVPLNLTLKKEETPNEIVNRLHANFLKETENAGRLRKVKKELVMEREKNQKFKSHLNRLEDLQKEKEMKDEMVRAAYEEQADLIEKTWEKVEHIERTMNNFKLIPI
uniref:BMERB domain-containing protein n=1 Tax=Caenorhabditis tropicalis TaxID=1561998 RepID=A0A1I7TYJ9_9PELO